MRSPVRLRPRAASAACRSCCAAPGFWASSRSCRSRCYARAATVARQLVSRAKSAVCCRSREAAPAWPGSQAGRRARRRHCGASFWAAPAPWPLELSAFPADTCLIVEMVTDELCLSLIPGFAYDVWDIVKWPREERYERCIHVFRKDWQRRPHVYRTFWTPPYPAPTCLVASLLPPRAAAPAAPDPAGPAPAGLSPGQPAPVPSRMSASTALV